MAANLANVLSGFNAGGAQREREQKLAREEKRRARERELLAKMKANQAAAAAGAGAGAAPGVVAGGVAKQPLKAKLKGSVNAFQPAPKPAAKQGAPGSRLAAHAAQAASAASAPLAKRVKDVLDALLKKVGDTLTPEELLAQTELDVRTDPELQAALHKHPRVTKGPGATGGRAAEWYAYKPEVAGVHDKTSLVNHIRDLRGRPALSAVLRKTYGRAAEDLQQLKEEGKVLIIGHPEPAKEVVFSCDMMGMHSVSEDVRGLWFEVTMDVQGRVPIPGDVTELQEAVTRAGLRSALANQPAKRFQPAGANKRAKARKPRQQRFNPEKATNAHMPQLFTTNQPRGIDG